MKSYSVKSNAKRFARGLAEKYSGVTPVEPVASDCSKSAWYPAVTAENLDYADAVADTAVVVNRKALESRTYEEVAAAMAEGDAGVYAVQAEDMVEPEAPANPDDRAEEILAMPPEERYETLRNSPVPRSHRDANEEAPAHVPAEIDVRDFGARGSIFDAAAKPPTFLDGSPEAKKAEAAFEANVAGPTASELAAMAASLPPRQTSTSEDIEARRAARRAAIEADKKAGVRDRLGRKVEPEKINKKKTILDLVSRDNGATQAELEAATGWQRHTLRGYIAGTLRKILRNVGRDIECRRAKDEATRYVMVAKEGGDA